MADVIKDLDQLQSTEVQQDGKRCLCGMMLRAHVEVYSMQRGSPYRRLSSKLSPS